MIARCLRCHVERDDPPGWLTILGGVQACDEYAPNLCLDCAKKDPTLAISSAWPKRASGTWAMKTPTSLTTEGLVRRSFTAPAASDSRIREAAPTFLPTDRLATLTT